MALSPERIASLVECNICMNTFFIPKNLNCGHVYCKDCLDKLLKFNEDGSAVIQCPFKCKNGIVIPKDGTTKSLSTSYRFVNIVDEINEQKNTLSGKRLDLCNQLQECRRFISWLCSICSMKTCDECKKNHHCKDGIFTPVVHNTKVGDIQPMCSKHDSHTDYVCLQCDHALICVYCLHRDHKNHRRNTVDDFGSKIKTRFQPFITSFDEVKDILPGLSKQYVDARSSLNMKIDELVNELKMRKLKRLEQYLVFLHRKEDHVLKVFDEKVEEFKLKVSTAGFYQMDSLCQKEFSDYVDNFKAKRNFELVVGKLQIEEKFGNLTLLPSVAPCFDMQLDEMIYGELLKSSLGQLKISVTDTNIVGIDIEHVSVEKSYITKIAHAAISEALNQSFESLTDLLKAYSGSSKIVDGTVADDVKLETRNKFELESSMPLKATRYYSFEELVQLIKTDDIDELKAIVTKDTSTVKMTNNRGETLLMRAVWYENIEIVKMLVDAGSDLWTQSKYGLNVYHFCVLCDQPKILQLLLNRDDKNINDVATGNYTPLHYASMNNSIKCAELLLSVPHFDVDIRARKMTAYEYARNDNLRRMIAAHKKKEK